MDKIGLYLHVPFCNEICGYCSFTRVKHNDSLIESWLKEIKKEIDLKVKNQDIDTIYIGGGTPSCLNNDQLERLLSYIPYSNKIIEYTIEANPESLTLDKIRILKKYHVNRVSMGVQTTNETLLKLMNRHHDKNTIKEVIYNLKNEGIDNISCDLMYSLPFQKMSDIKETIDFLNEQGINHISIYSLTIDDTSEFARKGYTNLDDETEANMYDFIISYLNSLGFEQYEISNFQRNNSYSRHNVHYWNYDDFIGISIGASGKENNYRYDNVTNFMEYFKGKYEKERYILDKNDLMFENVMMSLRMKRGLDLDLFEKRYGISFKEQYKKAIRECLSHKLIAFNEHYCYATEYGFHILNDVLLYFMD